MIYLFLGDNNFAKRAALEKFEREVTRVTAENEVPSLDQLSEATLFGQARVFVLENLLEKFDVADSERLAKSPHTIIFLEDALDKRKKTTTQWLKSPHVKVQEFTVPQDLSKWTGEQVGDMGGKIDKATIEYFLQVVLPEPSSNKFVQPKIDLYQLYFELQKLITYDATISKENIDALTTKNNSVEAWDIINALADRNAAKAFVAMEEFFRAESVDDKTKTIQLNALLADQFRNILLIQDFMKQRIPDAPILEQTGWKSGRLFITKKLAGKFQTAQILSVLDKLERLDQELKTTSAPGQTIIELIASQVV